MHTRTAPVRLRYATLFMLSLATTGLVAKPPEAQEKPSPRVLQRSQIAKVCVSEVPDLSRYDFDILHQVLKKHDLALGEVTGQPNSAPKGTIIGQSFKPGSPAKCGTPISVTVSTGPRPREDVKVPPDPQGIVRCQVPDLRKHHIDDVQAPVRKRQWSIGTIKPRESRATPGTILEQSPQAGVYEKCDWSIDVVVAVPEQPHPQDPPSCKVPDFTGLNIKDALGKVKGAGLGVESVVREYSPAPADTVIAQSEKPGTALACGSRLVLAIATAPPPPRIQYCDVPDMRGADIGVAQQTFAAVGLKVGGVKPENSDRPRDTVITQSLKAGSQVPCASAVYLRVSAGPAMCDVPNLEAVDLAGARRVLKERGFQLGHVATQISERIADTVLGQRPPANSTAVCNSAIDVLIAVPMPPVHVPALQGQDTDSARRKLEGASLTLGPVARKFADEAAAGLVIEQHPVPNTPVRRGSAVSVWVSDGPAPRPVPDLRRLDRGTAANVLSKASFQLGQVFERQFDATQGTIVDQQPAAGSVERVGTVVQVWVAVPVVFAVPSVIGKRENDAAATLANHRLRVGAIETRPSTEPRGTVIGQQPEPGQLVAANAIVGLVLAAPMPAPPPPPETPRPEIPPPPVVTPPAAGLGSTTNAVPEQTRAPVTPPAPAVPVPAVPEVAVSQLPAEAPRATADNATPPRVPVLEAIPNVVGLSATQASNVLRAAGFLTGTLSTTPSSAPAGTVTMQRPAAGQPAAPGTQVALEIAMPAVSEGTMPMWWVLLGIVGGAAAAGLMAKMRTRVPRALPPSVTFEPRPDGNMAVTLSEDGPLVRSELWLKACPDAGVQTAHGSGPFGMMEVTEAR